MSAILLYVFMSFDWFGVVATRENRSLLMLFQGSEPGRNAWEALDQISIVLLIAILAGVSVAVLRLMDAIHDPPAPVNAVVAALGILSVLLVLFRIVVPPSSGTEVLGGGWTLMREATVEPVMFLALAAAAGIAVGAFLAMREEGVFKGLHRARDPRWQPAPRSDA